MSAELLVEIGTEEIPSGYFEKAATEFKRLAESSLTDNRIRCTGDFFTYYTPRRLALAVEGLAEKQEDISQEVTGPPRKAAYDKDGNPTKAALGFAGKYGLAVEDLQTIETPKGEYLYLRHEITGRPTIEILSEILPGLISGIPWPKSMRWGAIGVVFVRPVHWVLALFDGRVIPIEVAGVKAGSETRGHRFMSPGPIEIKGHRDYLLKMERASVIVNPDDRRSKVQEEVIRGATEVSGIPIEDPELTITVANLVEFPSAVCGGFDKAFLDLPDPVLITAMREHQKYFALQDQEGKLIPHFIAVNNTIPRDESVVRRGHERVLNARLSDAVFFFKEDRKRPLADRLNDLKGVIYQAELGSSSAKVERFNRLALFLAEQVAPEKREEVELASRLCKCDLVTEMVMEFPTLQGVMGSEYARLDGHPEGVCLAIKEHYLPAKASDGLPSSLIGAIVGLADRMDTIAGCFTIGLEPTGAADPFALRRHSLAIIRILEGRGWDLSLREFISKSLGLLGEEIEFDRERVFNHVKDFFRERYRNRMLGVGYQSELIEAVVSAEFDRISELPSRIEHLKRFTEESREFQALALTFKRVSNILKGQEGSLSPDQGLFKEPCESELWEAYQALEKEIRDLTQGKKYLDALNLMARLRKPVDDFFEGVEVLTKESPDLRRNRLALLQQLAGLFLSLADFSKFSI